MLGDTEITRGLLDVIVTGTVALLPLPVAVTGMAMAVPSTYCWIGALLLSVSVPLKLVVGDEDEPLPSHPDNCAIARTTEAVNKYRKDLRMIVSSLVAHGFGTKPLSWF